MKGEIGQMLIWTTMIILPILEWLSRYHLIAAYYQLVSDQPPSHIRHLYACRASLQFKRDIDILLNRYKPIDIPQLAAFIRALEPLPKDFFLLTFDDVFRETYDAIAPILRRKGVPAVFFITSVFINNLEMAYDHKMCTIAVGEGLSSKIETIRKNAYDFRDREHFKTAIYLHCGGLNLNHAIYKLSTRKSDEPL